MSQASNPSSSSFSLTLKIETSGKELPQVPTTTYTHLLALPSVCPRPVVCPLSNPSICTLDPVSCLLEGIAPARFSFHTDSIKLSFFSPLNHPYKNTKQALKTKLFTLFVSSYNSFIVIPFAIRKFLELSILWLQSLSNSFFILIFPLCTLHTFCNCLTAKSRT